MAQYYKYGNGSDFNSMLGAYKYEEQNVKDVFQVIWEKAYALILNCNIIIEKCDERQDVYPVYITVCIKVKRWL